MIAAILLLFVALFPGAAAAGVPARAEALAPGAAYIVARQTASGAFFDADAPPDGVAEAVASLVAAGAGSSPAVGRAMAYVERVAPDRARTPAYAGRVVMGAVASGRNPRRLGGVDYVARIESGYNAASGAYETGVYAHALAVLGLRAARATVPEGALRYLRLNECSGGGFGHDAGCVGQPDVDTTAAAICALGTASASTRAWLDAARNDAGGYGLYADQQTNANSTGLALSAMACMGRTDDAAPAAALVGLRHSSGGFRYIASQAEPNDYATVQALPGLAGAAYPVRAGASRFVPPRAPDTPPEAAPAASAAPLPSATPCPSPTAAAPAGTLRAGLVIQLGDGQVREFCIPFSRTEELTGIDLLRRSGLPVHFGGTRSNASVCRIGTDGCSGDGTQCFCECRDAGDAACRFWGYYTLSAAGQWTFMDIGASVRRVRDGDVDGWRYANHAAGGNPPSSAQRPCLKPGVAARAAATGSASASRGGFNVAPMAAAAATVAVFAAATMSAVRRRRAGGGAGEPGGGRGD